MSGELCLSCLRPECRKDRVGPSVEPYSPVQRLRCYAATIERQRLVIEDLRAQLAEARALLLAEGYELTDEPMGLP